MSFSILSLFRSYLIKCRRNND